MPSKTNATPDQSENKSKWKYAIEDDTLSCGFEPEKSPLRNATLLKMTKCKTNCEWMEGMGKGQIEELD